MLPASMTLSGYLDNVASLKCPAGGTYTFAEDSLDVTCTKHSLGEEER